MYLTDRLDAAIRPARRRGTAPGLGDLVAVGEGHRALSHYQWYAADLRTAERQDEAAISVLPRWSSPGSSVTRRQRAYLAAGRADR